MKLSPSRKATPHTCIRPLPTKAIPSYQDPFQWYEIVKYYEIVPFKKGHPSYKAIPSYQARFQMHWDSKILLICPPQERPLLLKGHFFIAEEVALLSGITVNSYVFVNLSLETKLCWNGLYMIPYQSYLVKPCVYIFIQNGFCY
jgi:hypothetical protein